MRELLWASSHLMHLVRTGFLNPSIVDAFVGGKGGGLSYASEVV